MKTTFNRLISRVGLLGGLDLIILLISASTFFLICYTIYSSLYYSNFTEVITLLLVDLIFILALIVFCTRKFLSWIFQGNSNFRLRSRIILMFSIIAAIPTILVSSFSVFIFSLGLQGWFDKEVSTAVNQSAKVAEVYVSQNTLQLRESLITMAHDINSLHFELMRNGLLPRILSAHTEMRGITEALIFDRSSHAIIAQTALSFGLTLWALPQYIFEKADNGDIIEIDNDPGKLKMLIKLPDFPGDTYLMIGKLVDEETANYIDQTHGAAAKYLKLMQKKTSFQVSLGFAFLIISSILVLSTIGVGSYFASNIISPIRKLVDAIENVHSGDLSVQINYSSRKEDELVILTKAFNKMIKRLDIQQKDLAIAHRAMAWNDVARRVAHEIKNPLTPIALSAERLSKKFAPKINNDPEFVMYIGIIKRHTQDIQKIITSFADFAKMPSPIFEVKDIVSIIRQIIESRQIINESIKYSIKTDVTRIDFMCDITQMHQLMINIFKNAEEALERCPLDQKNIDTYIHLKGDEMVIIIQDNGTGFPDRLIDKVTESYITTSSNGMGLGLSIAKKIIYDHGGELLISNLQNQGACVELIFNIKTLLSKIKK